MNKKKTVIEEHKEIVTVKKKVKRTYPFCDLCGEQLGDDDEYIDDRHCTYYPLFEGCPIDVCEDCKTSKVIPWLESQTKTN